MTAAQLRDALKSLGLSQSAGARLLGVDGRTMRRWCAEPGPSAREVPPPVARFLWLMQAAGIGPAEVERLLEPFLRETETP
jgi:transcriptional regulator with XRE-family HTH domain